MYVEHIPSYFSHTGFCHIPEHWRAYDNSGATELYRDSLDSADDARWQLKTVLAKFHNRSAA